MKLFAGAAATLIMIACVPFMLLPIGGAYDVDDIDCASEITAGVALILDTIRTLESGGDYQGQSPNSTASGAYQFIDAAWQHRLAAALPMHSELYPTAASASPDIQDRVAARYVDDIHDGRLEAVPIIWYLPAALDNETLMDQVPAGNVYTPRQYQTRWLNIYESKLDAAQGPASAASCARENGLARGGWALPVGRDLLTDATIIAPHHDYPAWDLMIPVGTPIYAITGGHVVNTQHWDGNWWAAGCHSSGVNGCNTCGNGITIETGDGLRHTYCHNSALHVVDGDRIQPGQHIADSGDTGRSGGPHLHLELRVNGIQHCPQPLVAALYHRQPLPAPAALPSRGCTF